MMGVVTSCEEYGTVDGTSDDVVGDDDTSDDDDDLADEDILDTNFPTTEPSEDVTFDITPLPGDDSWRATIYMSNYFGRRAKHFLDFKWLPSSYSLATARVHFQTDKMTGVRIPIYGNGADTSASAHPKAGEVLESSYSSLISYIKNAKEALAEVSDEPLVVFASKKLNGTNSFPDWVIDASNNPTYATNTSGTVYCAAGTVKPLEYSYMLMDFFDHMYENGIEIDVLGIENENMWNKAGITEYIYAETVRYVKQWLAAGGYTGQSYAFREPGTYKIPQFLAPDNYAAANSYYTNLVTNEELNDTVDIFGQHYYPQQRTTSSNGKVIYDIMAADVAANGDREFWATEPHWDGESSLPATLAGTYFTDVLHYCELALGALWDQTDLGLDMICWWDYSRSGNTRGNIMQAAPVDIVGKQPITVIDHDGEAIRPASNYRKLQTRAFRDGSTVVLYIMNVCANTASNTSYTNYEFKVDKGTLYPKATVRQWRDDALTAGETTTIDTYNGETFYLDLPSRSVTQVTFNIDMRDVDDTAVEILE